MRENPSAGPSTCPPGGEHGAAPHAHERRRLITLRQSRLCNAWLTQSPTMLKLIRRHLKPHHRIYVGVIAPVSPRLETPEAVRDRVLEAAQHLPDEQLGTTDDCGCSPFSDDTSTRREVAFAEIRAPVLGTALADRALGKT